MQNKLWPIAAQPQDLPVLAFAIPRSLGARYTRRAREQSQKIGMRSLALLIVLVVLLACFVGAALLVAAPRPERARPRGKEGYLVYPYLDLDEPGERGSYYGLSECA